MDTDTTASQIYEEGNAYIGSHLDEEHNATQPVAGYELQTPVAKAITKTDKLKFLLSGDFLVISGDFLSE